VNNSVIINIHLLLAATWRRRYWILIPVAVFIVVALLTWFLAPKEWQSHTTILVQESAKMNPFLEDLSVSTDLENRITTLDTLLHSRHMLSHVGNDLGLITDNSTDKNIDTFVNKLSNSLSVKLMGKDLVKIVYKTEEIESIEEVLKAVRKRFLEKLLAPELSAIKASENFLQNQLLLKKQNLYQAELKLESFKKNNTDSLPSLYSANNARLAQMSELIEQKRIELSGAMAAKKSIRTRLAKVDPVMSEIEQSIVNTKSELALLRSRYTDNHSRVQTAFRKLTQLEDERKIQSKSSFKMDEIDLNRLWEVASKMEVGQLESGQHLLLVSQLQELQIADGRVEQLKEEINSITKQADMLKNTIVVSSEMERKLLELERDLAVKRELYSDLLGRFEKAKITGALGKFEQPERIKIIDEPYTPSSPNNFSLIIFLIAGLIGGLLLGSGFAIFLELTDTSIRSKVHLETITSVPVITRLPNIIKHVGV